MNRLNSLRVGPRGRTMGLAVASTVLIAVMVTGARAESPTGLTTRENPIVRAVRRVAPSVVNIHGQKTVRGTAAAFAGAQNDSVRQINGMGTGIVIDARGYLITNYHVVEDVKDIRVTLADNRTAIAEIIASDARYDLAVLKVAMDEPLQVVPLGTSSDLMVGEDVIAIGNAFGYENTVTNGIISALHRDVPVNDTQEYRDLIQTSASINPGNSGGPLLNIHGDVIGVNVAVRVGAQSIAFAIPIDQAITVARRIIHDYNEVRVSLGLVAADMSEDGSGVVVASLEHNGSARNGGLLPGDLITRVGDRNIRAPLDFELALLGIEPGQRIGLDIQRDGQRSKVEVEASQPDVGTDPRWLANRIWNVVGVRVESVSSASVSQMTARLRLARPYKGGLRVTSVRSGGPAEREKIRPGDILLGIQGWQTTSLQELDVVLNTDNVRSAKRSEYNIIRHGDVVAGYMWLAQQGTGTGSLTR